MTNFEAKRALAKMDLEDFNTLHAFSATLTEALGQFGQRKITKEQLFNVVNMIETLMASRYWSDGKLGSEKHLELTNVISVLKETESLL